MGPLDVLSNKYGNPWDPRHDAQLHQAIKREFDQQHRAIMEDMRMQNSASLHMALPKTLTEAAPKPQKLNPKLLLLK